MLPRGVLQAAPRWVAPVFGIGAILLVPWIVYLGAELPEKNVSRHWDVTWVGFDIVLLFALARTAWFAWRGRRQVELPAVASATLLLVDAWFDVTTSHPGWDMAQAAASAIFLEIPMALLALWIAAHVETVTVQAQRRIARLAALAAADGRVGVLDATGSEHRAGQQAGTDAG